MIPPEELDRFQTVLLSSLQAEGSTSDLTAAARAAAPDERFAAWVNAWDPDLVLLAAELVRTWVTTEDGTPA